MSRIAYVPLKEGEVIPKDAVVLYAQGPEPVHSSIVGTRYVIEEHVVPLCRPVTLPQWVRFEERLPTMGEAIPHRYHYVLVRNPSGDVDVSECEIDRIAWVRAAGFTEWLSGLDGVGREGK